MLPFPDPSVICQRLDEGAVLFSPATELYFGLNETGLAVWELLPPATRSRDELCAAIARRYPGVDAETVRADVGELLERLVSEGLASDAGAASPDAGAAA